MAIINRIECLNSLPQPFIDNMKIFHLFGDSGENLLVVSKDDNVYQSITMRSRADTALSMRTQPLKVDELCAKCVNKFDSCHDFKSISLLALTANGDVYSWSYNNYERPSDEQPNIIMHECMNGIKVVDICCGGSHSLLLTEMGEVFAFGNNYFGQIGNQCNDSQLTPVRLLALDNEKVVSISCGLYHSLALTENGDVFSWGYNDDGQLGIGNTQHRNTPVAVSFGNQPVIIDKISCGQWHTLLLSRDGDIYAFGFNIFGQLGCESRLGLYCTPVRIRTSIKFKDIAASHYRDLSVALSTDGKCFVWGKCGQIITEPRETQLTCTNEAFVVHSRPQITYKSVHLVN